MQTNNSSTDVELGLPSASSAVPTLQGYPSLARWIAQDRDAAVYRKFENLSARNILYLTSELVHLEKQLEALDCEDVKDGSNEAKRAARYWKHYADGNNVAAKRHVELQLKIRAILKEYHETLLRESQVLALRQPRTRVLRTIRTWFKYPRPVLWGDDEAIYDNDADLVTLAPSESDRLTTFIQKYLGWCLKERLPPEEDTRGRHKNLFYYSDRRVQWTSALVSTVISAVLLVGAIVCLSAIPPRSVKLRTGMIVLFMCLFALVVGMLMNARKAELFGATAAYAAVLVVFATNSVGDTPS